MSTVKEILEKKGAAVHSIVATATVLEATQKMNLHRIGSLVVMHEGRIVGIFTERDVLRRVVADQKSPARISVGNVMTREVVCCQPEADMQEVAAVMKNKRIRHVPVCDEDGQILGIVSIGDINAHWASHQEATIHFLNDYIYGRA